MLQFALAFTLLFVNLLALTPLQTNYYTKSTKITLGDVIKGESSSVVLYTMPIGKTTKRVKAKELVKLLTAYGHKNYVAKHAYVQFSMQSPIDTTQISKSIKEYYQNSYKNIDILNVTVHPRTYIQNLPADYSVKLKSRSYLKSQGILSIISKKHKSYFFNYHVKAKVSVYMTKQIIERKSELSFKNSTKKSIILNKFRSLPIQEMNEASLQSKYKIKEGEILTKRNTSKLLLVKRGASLNVFLQNNNMSITFGAKSNQDGSLGDTINVTKIGGRKIAVIVTGKNQAKVK